MTAEPGPGPGSGPAALRAALRRGLISAMKAPEADADAALRTALAAIDNAEAVPAPDTSAPTSSAHVAGARPGLGAAEAARRPLSDDEARAVVREPIAEQTREAGGYDAHGHGDAARRLRDQARVLAAYL
jgi:hypothetical protein